MSSDENLYELSRRPQSDYAPFPRWRTPYPSPFVGHPHCPYRDQLYYMRQYGPFYYDWLPEEDEPSRMVSWKNSLWISPIILTLIGQVWIPDWIQVQLMNVWVCKKCQIDKWIKYILKNNEVKNRKKSHKITDDYTRYSSTIWIHIDKHQMEFFHYEVQSYTDKLFHSSKILLQKLSSYKPRHSQSENQ